jgi:hypothetical protein
MQARNPQEQLLNNACGSARLLGTTFIAIGGIVVLLGYGLSGGPFDRLMAASAGLFVVGPGVLYMVAAHLLARRVPQGAVMARWGAAGHALVIFLLLALGMSGLLSDHSPLAIVPAFLCIFFLPAMVAMLVETRRAQRAAEMLSPAGRAFEPLPARPLNHTPAQPAELPASPASPDEPSHPAGHNTSSLRGK